MSVQVKRVTASSTRCMTSLSLPSTVRPAVMGDMEGWRRGSLGCERARCERANRDAAASRSSRRQQQQQAAAAGSGGGGANPQQVRQPQARALTLLKGGMAAEEVVAVGLDLLQQRQHALAL